MAMVSGIRLQANPGPAAEMVDTSGGAGVPQPPQPRLRMKEEKVPQWSQQETRDLIAIRAELERDLAVARRSRTLWEAVAARMRERGHRRTPDQCNCKWKNLVNRYKVSPFLAADPADGRQCPFFEELNAVFLERATNTQRLLLESDSTASPSKKKLKRLRGDRSSSDEFPEDENGSDEERLSRSRKKKADSSRGGGQRAVGIRELLQEFLQQQRRMELQWQDTVERRGQERRDLEHEWRLSMEKLERERLLLEQAWREREEQRRMREESRAEKRDALLTTLLSKLIQDDI
ncbi:hypothetical protein B296_00055913 [Ensete ventricosum]|uniref:Myb-like domain-containing protein n=1 Tax=Ensete ventricosum TaxID=4639 RepID=A0A426X134_ENSVE|nr:hypothetical protein B296_00055913 [Ensete ventricosum]